MGAGKYNFTIQQGSTFERQIQYRDSAGDPVDLTNYGARMQIRPSIGSDTVIISLTSDSVDVDGTGIIMTTPSSGTFTVKISAASSSGLTFSNEAVYDLEIYSGSGVSTFVSRILQGSVRLSEEVTR